MKLSWDNLFDREMVLNGPESNIKTIDLMESSDSRQLSQVTYLAAFIA